MKRNTQAYFVFTITGIISLIALTFGTNLYLSATDYAETAQGVDVYVVTPSNTVAIGVPFTADVFITNDKTPLNAMEAEIFFDATLFAVTDFTFSTSLCEERFVIDKIIDNDTGVIHVSCGTVTPFSGNATVFGTVHATSIQAGITNITFGEKTHVYVHDGLGTEIARDTYSATLVIGNAGA